MLFNMSTILQLEIKIKIHLFWFCLISHQWRWHGLEIRVREKYVSDLTLKVIDPTVKIAIPLFSSGCEIWAMVLPSTHFQGGDSFKVTNSHFSSWLCTHIQYDKNARLSLSVSYLWSQNCSKDSTLVRFMNNDEKAENRIRRISVMTLVLKEIPQPWS